MGVSLEGSLLPTIIAHFCGLHSIFGCPQQGVARSNTAQAPQFESDKVASTACRHLIEAKIPHQPPETSRLLVSIRGASQPAKVPRTADAQRASDISLQSSDQLALYTP